MRPPLLLSLVALLFAHDRAIAAKDATAISGAKISVAGEASVNRFSSLFAPFQTENAALSPDGKLIAYSYREGETLSVVVIDLAQPSKPTARVLVVSDAQSTSLLNNLQEKIPAKIRWLRWTSPTRVAVETNQSFSAHYEDYWTDTSGEVLAFDYDGKNSRVLVTPSDVAEVIPDPRLGLPPSQFESITMPDEPPPNLMSGMKMVKTGPHSKKYTASTDKKDPDDPIPDIRHKPRSIHVVDLVAKENDSILLRAGELQKYNLYKLNAKTGTLSSLSTESVNAEHLPLLDRQGRPRIVIPSSTKISFPHPFALDQRSGLSRWTHLDKIAGFNGAGFWLSPENFLEERALPLGFDEDPNLLYFASNIGRDTYGIYSLNLKTGQRGKVTVENPNFDLIQLSDSEYPDPSALVYDRFTRNLVGLRFDSTFRTTLWFTPELAAAQKELETTLTGRTVEIQEWDSANKRFLVFAQSPTEAGAYYVFDREAGKVSEVAQRAPTLDPKSAQPTMPFDFANPNGGGTISGLLTLPRAVRERPMPVVVRCANEPWQRTRSDFNPTVRSLAEMGFAVVQVNPRGAWGFGSKQRRLTAASYEEAQIEDIGAALDFLCGKFPFLNPKHVALLGEDRGGYLALRALQLDPKRYRCAVTINPTVNVADWIGNAHWVDGATGPALTRSYFGDAKTLRTSPLSNHPETLRLPVCLFSYPGPFDGPRTIAYLDAKQLSYALKSNQTPVEFYDLSEDFAQHLPNASAQVMTQIEGFLNAYIYAYKVGMQEAIPEKN